MDDSLTWMLWSTNLGLLLSSSSSGATAAGTETLDGRTAEIYAIDSSGLSIPGVPGNLLPITSLTGNIWVDQVTGALLKAVLDYQADVGDNSGTLKGSGTGHLEITVTQIGNVTVTLARARVSSLIHCVKEVANIHLAQDFEPRTARYEVQSLGKIPFPIYSQLPL
jgi:hypothetical protein